ncbi:MAG: tetratricopeptide repeat protein [Synergistaceae bacterium]|jgi:tetratricopeptide (TPR) repeat protein|nr:tetratricopeptide repeat protein [Synergistaceae bacterium]
MPEMLRRAIKTAAVAFLLTAFASGCFGRAFAAETLFDRAKNLYDVREYKVALAYFQKVIESEPENGEAWDFAGWCHRYNGDWASALNAFAKAKELLPGELSKWVNVGEGEAYYGAGVYEKAVNAFAEAISLAPNDEELAVRAAKGIIFAYAAQNDGTSMEKALADLSEEYPVAESDIKGEAGALFEKAQEKAEKESSASGGEASSESPEQAERTIAQKITDVKDRLSEAVEALTSGDVTVREPAAGAEVSADTEEPAVSGDDTGAPAEQETPVEEPEQEQSEQTEPEQPQAEQPEQTAPAEQEPPAQEPEQAQPEPEQPEPAQAKSWELPTLGAPIADVLAKLDGDGIAASKAEVETPDGLWLYMLAFPPEIETPDVAGEKPDTKNSRIEEFDGKLLAIVIANNWVNHENSVVFKDELFAGAVKKLNAEIGSDAVTNETGLLNEAQWKSADERQVIVLSVSATLEGNVTAEKVYNDMTGLTAWLETPETAGGGIDD